MIIRWLIVRTHATLFSSTDKGNSEIVTAAEHRLDCKESEEYKRKIIWFIERWHCDSKMVTNYFVWGLIF